MNTLTSDALIPLLSRAVDGLLMPSETDAPFQIIAWPADALLSTGSVLQRLGYPAATAIEVLPPGSVFGALTRRSAAMDAASRATAARFAALETLLRTQLTDLAVYRVGRVEIQLLILGRARDRRVLGVQTLIVTT